jgi:hypothetical protein
VVSVTLLPLYLRGKRPRYPLDRRLGGPRGGLDDVEKRKFLLLPGLELDPSAGRHPGFPREGMISIIC